jgi:hypothetical protein
MSGQIVTERGHESLRIHLAYGRSLMKGWINVDIFDFGQEVIADLEER